MDARPTSGTAYLRRRSQAAGMGRRLQRIERALVLCADARDAAALRALLHLLYGYGITAVLASTIGAALDRLAEEAPDLVIIDDRLPPGSDIRSAIVIIRSLGCNAPLVVVRSRKDPLEARALLDAGAADLIDRDRLSASRVTEALLRIGRGASEAPR